jgi:hypothetical protein
MSIGSKPFTVGIATTNWWFCKSLAINGCAVRFVESNATALAS